MDESVHARMNMNWRLVLIAVLLFGAFLHLEKAQKKRTPDLNPIEQFAAKLNNLHDGGLWTNGFYYSIPAPANASIPQVVKGYFEASSGDRRMPHYRFLRSQKVRINNNEYVAALVDTIRCQRIILISHNGQWSTREFETDESKPTPEKVACADQETDKEFIKRIARDTPKETVPLLDRIIRCNALWLHGLNDNGCRAGVILDEETLRRR